MVENIKEVKLLAVREGTYSVYVFEVLENGEFIMCTRLPNWKTPEISIGDEGFLQYQIVSAGESYYDPVQDKPVKYLYSNVYFINFIQKNNIIKNNELIL